MIPGMSTWSEYVSTLTAGFGTVEAGEKVGVNGSTISRWRKGKAMPRNPAEAASLASEFGGDVLEAFVAAGYLTPEQAHRPAKQNNLRAVPGTVLAREVTRRLTGSPSSLEDSPPDGPSRVTHVDERPQRLSPKE